jgi:hypothetical protein
MYNNKLTMIDVTLILAIVIAVFILGYTIYYVYRRFMGRRTEQQRKQSTIDNQQPTINNQQSTINNQQPTTNNQQSTINNQQSTINNQQSTINNQQSTINNQQHKERKQRIEGVYQLIMSYKHMNSSDSIKISYEKFYREIKSEYYNPGTSEELERIFTEINNISDDEITCMLQQIHDERMIRKNTHTLEDYICMHFLLVLLETRVADVLKSKKANNDETEGELKSLFTEIEKKSDDQIIRMLQQIHDERMIRKNTHTLEDYICMHSLLVLLETRIAAVFQLNKLTPK